MRRMSLKLALSKKLLNSLIQADSMLFWIILTTAFFFMVLFISKWMFPLLYKILKFFMILGIVCVMIFGTLAYLDARELKQRFPVENKLFLLDLDQHLVAGYVFGKDGQTPQYIRSFETYQHAYDEQDFGALLGDNYKLLLIKKEAFESVYPIDFAGVNLTLEQAFQLLSTENPKKTYTDLLIQTLSSSNQAMAQAFVDKAFKTEAEFKDQLFAVLFSKAILQEGPIYLIREYREGNLLIYPETLAFKTIKKLPDDLFQLVSEKIKLS